MRSAIEALPTALAASAGMSGTRTAPAGSSGETSTQTIPGFVDETDGALRLDAADDAVNYGVVDEIARRVLLTRGRVLAVRREDIPGRGPAAAILRYPV